MCEVQGEAFLPPCLARSKGGADDYIVEREGANVEEKQKILRMTFNPLPRVNSHRCRNNKMYTFSLQY